MCAVAGSPFRSNPGLAGHKGLRYTLITLTMASVSGYTGDCHALYFSIYYAIRWVMGLTLVRLKYPVKQRGYLDKYLHHFWVKEFRLRPSIPFCDDLKGLLMIKR